MLILPFFFLYQCLFFISQILLSKELREVCSVSSFFGSRMPCFGIGIFFTNRLGFFLSFKRLCFVQYFSLPVYSRVQHCVQNVFGEGGNSETGKRKRD